jgi:hypothetical protein
MNAKKILESRIRGWFPKEPILRREHDSSSWNAQSGTLPTEKEFESLRLQHKKAYFLVSACLLLGMGLFLYLEHNGLVDIDLAGASLTSIMTGLLYSVAGLNIYVERKTILRHTIDKKVLPVIAFSVIVILCLWIAAAVNLIGFANIILAVPIPGFSAYFYYFAVDNCTKGKIRNSKQLCQTLS